MQCLVKILDRMMSGACSAIADQNFAVPWRESMAKLTQVRQDGPRKQFLNVLQVISAGKLQPLVVKN